MAVLLGIDLETTGLDENTDRITEVGAVLWDTDHQAPIKVFSTLVWWGGGIDDSISKPLSGITNEICALGDYIRPTIKELNELAGGCEYLCAHNASFEESFLKAAIEHCNFSEPLRYLPEKRYIDTMTDLPYPKMKGDGSLSEILMNHGIFNPLPHRALTDALAMMQLLAKYPFEEVEKLALTPSMVIVARVDYGNKELARNLGYKWNRFVPNQWAKKIKVDKYDLEQQLAYNAGFEVYEAQKEEPCPTS